MPRYFITVRLRRKTVADSVEVANFDDILNTLRDLCEEHDCNISELTIKASVETVCQTCGGDGTVVCHSCGGSGEGWVEGTRCARCSKGSGELTCPDCNGKGDTKEW